MPLPTFATREEIPDAFRDEYIEKDGKWVPNVEDVSGLKSALERQKEEARQAKARAKELEELQKAKAAGITDEQLAKLRQEIAAEKAPLEEKVTRYEQELRSLKLDSRIKSMLGEAGANPARLDALLKLTLERFDLNDSGTPIVKDQPTADLKKYIGEKIAAEYPELFLSKQKGGTGASGSGGTGAADVAKLIDAPGGAMKLLELANSK